MSTKRKFKRNNNQKSRRREKRGGKSHKDLKVDTNTAKKFYFPPIHITKKQNSTPIEIKYYNDCVEYIAKYFAYKALFFSGVNEPIKIPDGQKLAKTPVKGNKDNNHVTNGTMEDIMNKPNLGKWGMQFYMLKLYKLAINNVKLGDSDKEEADWEGVENEFGKNMGIRLDILKYYLNTFDYENSINSNEFKALAQTCGKKSTKLGGLNVDCYLSGKIDHNKPAQFDAIKHSFTKPSVSSTAATRAGRIRENIKIGTANKFFGGNFNGICFGKTLSNILPAFAGKDGMVVATYVLRNIMLESNEDGNKIKLTDDEEKLTDDKKTEKRIHLNKINNLMELKKKINGTIINAPILESDKDARFGDFVEFLKKAVHQKFTIMNNTEVLDMNKVLHYILKYKKLPNMGAYHDNMKWNIFVKNYLAMTKFFQDVKNANENQGEGGENQQKVVQQIVEGGRRRRRKRRTKRGGKSRRRKRRTKRRRRRKTR